MITRLHVALTLSLFLTACDSSPKAVESVKQPVEKEPPKSKKLVLEPDTFVGKNYPDTVRIQLIDSIHTFRTLKKKPDLPQPIVKEVSAGQVEPLFDILTDESNFVASAGRCWQPRLRVVLIHQARAPEYVEICLKCSNTKGSIVAVEDAQKSGKESVEFGGGLTSEAKEKIRDWCGDVGLTNCATTNEGI